MGDCCADESQKKRQEMMQFVRQKAKNFKEMLRPFATTPKHQEWLQQYDESLLEELVNTYLSPLYATNMLSVARDAIVSNLSITDAAVIEKIGRYLECFCQCLL